MEDNNTIKGFSKLTKEEKLDWVVQTFFEDSDQAKKELKAYWYSNGEIQKLLDGFSENTISNFPMPLGVAPNFVIDGKTYAVPMVIEESSVVAAAASAAKFWMSRGGFKTEILGTKKLGQVHFLWKGDKSKLKSLFPELKSLLIKDSAEITFNMNNRGGGIMNIELTDLTDKIDHLYQIKASFETCDSMGANFINTCLESFADTLRRYFASSNTLDDEERDLEVVMSILSNYTPECVVRATVSCPVEELGAFGDRICSMTFASRFCTAVKIAINDPYRATTHNKGIFNGIDAVVIATGNDFRAIEACGHTYACRSGAYRSLSDCSIEDGIFKFWLEIPLALGTVGGLTSLHPIARRSLEMLGNPTAQDLMKIIASVGLAQNFGALKSLVTTGIQKGHMKMHLQNILIQMNANKEEITKANQHFENETISVSAVKTFLELLRD